jgi:hypothetical protein
MVCSLRKEKMIYRISGSCRGRGTSDFVAQVVFVDVTVLVVAVV